MARSIVLPTATYPAGQRIIGPVNIANGLTRLTVDVQRCTSAAPTIWPSSTARLHQVWEQSLDAGQTWFGLYEAETWGGIAVQTKTGLEMPLATFVINFEPGTQRRLRATFTLDESIRTQVGIDVV